MKVAGLHSAFYPRGGEMSNYKKKGGRRHVHKHMHTRGVWGHAPPGNFCFLDSLRLLLVHSQRLCSGMLKQLYGIKID